ncbi:uncharacterized protein [Anabrus simplex]|uniref:uncharacterized protein isoform X2 n=1 Tax=Anabrus simplex TaxID=316456 RepID=UPI0035A32CC8
MCITSDFTTVSRIAAAVSLVQGVIWIALSIVGLLLHRCKIDVSINGSVSYLIYLVYFFNKKCDNAPGFLNILQHDWPLEAVGPAERTKAFSATELAFNWLWVLTSVALLLTTFPIPIVQRKKFYFVFGWICTTICILVLDVVGASLYGFDFIKTSSADGLLRLLGVEGLSDDWKTYMPTRYYEYHAVPTAVLMLVASRFFPIFWIIDLILLIKVVRFARQQGLQNREGDEAAKQHALSSSPQARMEMQQLNDDYQGETTELNRNAQTNIQGDEDLNFQEMSVHEENPTHSKQQEERVLTHSNDNGNGIILTDESPMQTSSPQLVRSSVLSRLSTLSQTPQGLQNQLPWSYLGRPSSSNDNPLNRRTSSMKSNGTG